MLHIHFMNSDITRGFIILQTIHIIRIQTIGKKLLSPMRVVISWARLYNTHSKLYNISTSLIIIALINSSQNPIRPLLIIYRPFNYYFGNCMRNTHRDSLYNVPQIVWSFVTLKCKWEKEAFAILWLAVGFLFTTYSPLPVHPVCSVCVQCINASKIYIHLYAECSTRHLLPATFPQSTWVSEHFRYTLPVYIL